MTRACQTNLGVLRKPQPRLYLVWLAISLYLSNNSLNSDHDSVAISQEGASVSSHRNVQTRRWPIYMQKSDPGSRLGETRSFCTSVVSDHSVILTDAHGNVRFPKITP